jgi:hypothetical protein
MKRSLEGEKNEPPMSKRLKDCIHGCMIYLVFETGEKVRFDLQYLWMYKTLENCIRDTKVSQDIEIPIHVGTKDQFNKLFDIMLNCTATSKKTRESVSLIADYLDCPFYTLMTMNIRPAWCSEAARLGEIVWLRHLHENHCYWGKTTCTVAAQYGRFDCLQYAYENGCPCDSDKIYRLISHSKRIGCKDCLQYVGEKLLKKWVDAIRRGHERREVVKIFEIMGISSIADLALITKKEVNDLGLESKDVCTLIDTYARSARILSS